MRNLVLLIIYLVIIGCEQGDGRMATIGEETGLAVVSTNVVESAPTFNPDGSVLYADGTVVQYQDGLYSVSGMYDTPVFNAFTNYAVGDSVRFGGKLYETTALFEAETSKGFIYGRMWAAYSAPTFTQLTTQNVDFDVGDYRFRSRVVGSEPHTALVTKVTFIPTLTDLGEFILAHMDDLEYPLDYRNDGYLQLPDPGDRWVFYDGVLYGMWATVGSPEDYVNFTQGVVVDDYLTLTSAINPLKPFDGENINPATHDGTVSDMQYVLKGTEVFNSFTLAKVLASSITYTFTLPVGDPEYALWLDGDPVLEGGNGIVKTDTSTIDCKRDSKGILSDYPTSRVFYADRQMPVDSTVTISIAYGGTISLGDLTFNNAIKDTLTNLDFGHAIQDYNDYTPDPWGKIPEAVKAKVTAFNITMDVLLENYDYAVSFHESIAGKNVMIDASDSKGQPRDGKRIFSSLIRRVRVTHVTSNSIVKDGDLYRLAGVTMSVTEVV